MMANHKSSLHIAQCVSPTTCQYTKRSYCYRFSTESNSLRSQHFNLQSIPMIIDPDLSNLAQNPNISPPVHSRYPMIILFLLVMPPSARIRSSFPFISTPFYPRLSLCFPFPIFPFTLSPDVPLGISEHTNFT